MPQASFTDLPLTATADGVRVRIRLTPRAGTDRIDGLVRLADASLAVKIAVAAPPAENRANDALLQFLAREWGLPRRALSIASGHRSRSKTVHIAGPPAALLPRVAAWLTNLRHDGL